MTNLNFWVLANSGIHTASHLNALLAEFERENPKIQVEISVLNRSALWRRLFSCLQEARECEPADVVQIPHYWTALFGRLGFFEDLAELDPKISLRDWLEPLRPHCTLHQTGRIYSLPWWMDATALHYRADHLAQITKEPEEALSKWDGFLKICAELSRKKRPAGYYPLENSNLRGLASCRDVLPRVWARGGDILTPDGTRATLLRDEFLRGVDDYLSLFRKGLMPLLRERGSLGTMLEGKASMTISRRRAPAPPPEAGAVEVRTLPVPGGLFGSHAYLSSYNLAVSKESARSKEALSLVKWLCRDDSQAKYSQLIGAFPCSCSGFEHFIFSSQERLKTYASIVADAKTVPNLMVCGTFMDVLDSALAKMSLEIAKNSYSPEILSAEMGKVQAEMDYLLSLYGG